MKYKTLKPITLNTLFAQLLEGRSRRDTCCAVRQFVIIARMISHNINSSIDLSFFTERSAEYPEWIPWLVRYGFIEEEKKEERLYAVGQRLFHWIRGEYLIAQVGRGQINLIGLKDGNRWAEEPVTVEHFDKITEDDMSHFSFWDEFSDKRPSEHD